MRVLSYSVAADGTKTIDNIEDLGIDDLAVIAGLDGFQHYAAEPYRLAMKTMSSIEDSYGADDGRSVVMYFLSNATSWRGPIARQVKAELKRRLGR